MLYFHFLLSKFKDVLFLLNFELFVTFSFNFHYPFLLPLFHSIFSFPFSTLVYICTFSLLSLFLVYCSIVSFHFLTLFLFVLLSTVSHSNLLYPEGRSSRNYLVTMWQHKLFPCHISSTNFDSSLEPHSPSKLGFNAPTKIF